MGSRVDVGDKTNCALLSPVEVKSSSHSCMVFVSNNNGGKLSIIIKGVRFVRKTYALQLLIIVKVIEVIIGSSSNVTALLLTKEITVMPLKQLLRGHLTPFDSFIQIYYVWKRKTCLILILIFQCIY